MLDQDSIIEYHIETCMTDLSTQVHLSPYLRAGTMERGVHTIRSESAPAKRHVNALQEHDPFRVAAQRTVMITMESSVPSQNSNP